MEAGMRHHKKGRFREKKVNFKEGTTGSNAL
jgi:hypothetical protein